MQKPEQYLPHSHHVVGGRSTGGGFRAPPPSCAEWTLPTPQIVSVEAALCLDYFWNVRREDQREFC